MLTSFFNKSKPIQFILVGIYMTFFYCISNFIGVEEDTDALWVLKKISGLIAFLTSMMVIHFFIRRNEFTRNKTYKIFLFAAFTALFQDLLINTDLIFANLFLVMGLRRLIGLQTHRFTKEKIFDAVFWICLASLFSFWTVWFFVLVFFGILMYAAQNFRNWLIPIIGFIAIGILVTCFHLFFYDDFYSFQEWYQISNFDFSQYRNLEVLIPLSLLLALLVWSLPYFLNVLRSSSAVSRPTLLLILIYLAASVFVGIFSVTKNSSELIFFLVPLAVIVATYLKKLEDKWFKETLLMILAILPFFLLLF